VSAVPESRRAIEFFSTNNNPRLCCHPGQNRAPLTAMNIESWPHQHLLMPIADVNLVEAMSRVRVNTTLAGQMLGVSGGPSDGNATIAACRVERENFVTFQKSTPDFRLT